MITGMIFPARYVQGSEILKRLGEEAKIFGKNALLLSDEFVLEKILPKYLDDIKIDISIHLEKFGGECSDEEINRLKEIVKEKTLKMVIGIGGGKTLDTAKAVAHFCEVPVVIVPTIASTDAPCSALAVIYTNEGEFDRYLVLPKNPEMVLVDSKVIADAPSRFIVSGMGDALATYFEAESCRKVYASNMPGYKGTMTAYALAELCYDTLLEYGLSAKISVDVNAVTPALEKIIEANTLLSGIGFESGGLGAAHAIHNGLTAIEGTHEYFHGEKVAFGTLTSLFLTDRSPVIIDEVFDFCISVGLPITFEDIGMKKPSKEELKMVAEKSLAEGETIHNEPIPISVESLVSALLATDAEGRRRKDLM